MNSKTIILLVFITLSITVSMLVSMNVIDITGIFQTNTKNSVLTNNQDYMVEIISPTSHSYWNFYYNGEYYWTWVAVKSTKELKAVNIVTSFPLIEPPAVVQAGFDGEYYYYRVILKTSKKPGIVESFETKNSVITVYPEIKNTDGQAQWVIVGVESKGVEVLPSMVITQSLRWLLKKVSRGMIIYVQNVGDDTELEDLKVIVDNKLIEPHKVFRLDGSIIKKHDIVKSGEVVSVFINFDNAKKKVKVGVMVGAKIKKKVVKTYAVPVSPRGKPIKANVLNINEIQKDSSSQGSEFPSGVVYFHKPASDTINSGFYNFIELFKSSNGFSVLGYITKNFGNGANSYYAYGLIKPGGSVDKIILYYSKNKGGLFTDGIKTKDGTIIVGSSITVNNKEVIFYGIYGKIDNNYNVVFFKEYKSAYNSKNSVKFNSIAIDNNEYVIAGVYVMKYIDNSNNNNNKKIVLKNSNNNNKKQILAGARLVIGKPRRSRPSTPRTLEGVYNPPYIYGLLVKIDADGNVIMTKKYVNTEFNDVIVDNGKYYIAGDIVQRSKRKYFGAVFVLDSSGNILNIKQYPFVKRIKGILKTQDGYIIYGGQFIVQLDKNLNIKKIYQLSLVHNKIDAKIQVQEGTIQNSKNTRKIDEYTINNIIIDNNEYIITLYVTISESNKNIHFPFIFKTDSNMNPQTDAVIITEKNIQVNTINVQINKSGMKFSVSPIQFTLYKQLTNIDYTIIN